MCDQERKEYSSDDDEEESHQRNPALPPPPQAGTATVKAKKDHQAVTKQATTNTKIPVKVRPLPKKQVPPPPPPAPSSSPPLSSTPPVQQQCDDNPKKSQQRKQKETAVPVVPSTRSTRNHPTGPLLPWSALKDEKKRQVPVAFQISKVAEEKKEAEAEAKEMVGFQKGHKYHPRKLQPPVGPRQVSTGYFELGNKMAKNRRSKAKVTSSPLSLAAVLPPAAAVQENEEKPDDQVVAMIVCGSPEDPVPADSPIRRPTSKRRRLGLTGVRLP